MRKIVNRIFYHFKENTLAKCAKDRVVLYKEIQEIENCLLFYTVDTNPEVVVEVLKKAMPRVEFCKLCFVPMDMQIVGESDVVFYRPEELGFGGKIRNERLDEILAKEFDLLVDLTLEPSVMTHYVLQNTQAHCIVGRKRKEAIADIVIDGGKDLQDFALNLTALFAEIKRYEYEKI